MIKLTTQQFDAIKADSKIQIIKDISIQLAGLLYRDEMEESVFSDDVANDFLAKIKKEWDCSNFDDSDLVEWIRDIQSDIVEQTVYSVFVSLDQFISDKFGSQVDFARKQGVMPQQVTQWLEKDFIVADGKLYSYRRELQA